VFDLPTVISLDQAIGVTSAAAANIAGFKALGSLYINMISF
jgi:hypothetical protein